MKKVFTSLGIVLLMAAFAFAGTLPAPFDNAKKLAMISEQVEEGLWSWEAKDPVNPELVFYAIGYYKPKDRLSLGRVGPEGAGLICYEAGKYTFEIYVLTPFGFAKMDEQELTEEEAVSMAFEFYRHLVFLDLLPSPI